MHCNGHCVLMKKLKDQETKDQQTPERKSENKSEIISAGSFYTTPDVLSIQKVPLMFLAYQETTLLKQPGSIFHPPNV
jgi:hypothetical protein